MARSLTLVVAGDSNYAPGIAVLLWSARRYLDPDVTLDSHIIDGGLTESDVKAIENALSSAGSEYQLTIHPVPDIEGVTSQRTRSPMFYARVLIPDLLPQLDRALYLDADIIVKRDLSPLLDLDFDGKLAFASRDRGIPTLGYAGPPSFEDLPLEEYNLPLDAPYMNTGMLWMNLDGWRKSSVSEDTFKLGREQADRWVCQDQSVLNVTMHGQWLELDESWNRQIWLNENFWVITPPGPAILHFTFSKPWQFPLDRPIGIVRFFTHCFKECGWPQERYPEPITHYPRQPGILQQIREARNWVHEHGAYLWKKRQLATTHLTLD